MTDSLRSCGEASRSGGHEAVVDIFRGDCRWPLQHLEGHACGEHAKIGAQSVIVVIGVEK
jgi:hypothetical protein